MEKMHKATLWEKLGYGLGEVPGTMQSILAAVLMMFYTDSVGMAAGAVGTMFFVSRLFDGISDLIAGNIVDKTRTKWGKARPWLLWLSIPTGLALALIFWIPAEGSATVKMIYAFVTYNLYISILYTMVGVAKSALMPLISQDGGSRGALAIFSLIFGLGGTILGMSVTFPFLYALGGDLRAWRIIFIVYGVITTLSMLGSFLLTRENVQSVEAVTSESHDSGMSFGESVKNFVKNKYFLFALAMVVIVNLAVQINSGAQTYFYQYVMNDIMLMTSMNLVNLIPTIIGIVFLSGLSLRFFGKKKSVYIGCAGQILGHCLRGVAAMTTSVPLLMVGTVISAIATGPLSVPINMLTADAVDYGEWLTNKRIEGMGSAIVSFSQKLSNGLASAIVGWVLALTGYVADAVQGSSTVFGITFISTWFPAILLVIVIISFVIVYRYDKEEAEVMAELARRKESKAN
jgi:GPH family glycoside/pentoside/hexuronide:cation symporter